MKAYYFSVQVATLILLFFFSSGTGYAQNNNALYFDGVNDYLPTSNPITGTGSFTLEAKVKTTATGVTNRYLITLGDGTGDFQLVWFFMNEFGHMCVGMRGSSHLISTSAINDGKWHHVAVRYSNYQFSIYIDGEYNTSAGGFYPNITGTSTVIGSVSTADQCFWNGLIDEVRIWNIAVSPDSIRHYSNYPLHGSRPNLLKSYNFNQGTAFGNNAGLTSVINESGNLLPSTIHNFALTGNQSNWVSAGMRVDGNNNTANDNANITNVTTLNNTNMGLSEHGESITKSFTIRNYGDSLFTIPSGGITFSGYDPEDFAYSGITLPVSIDTGQSASFTVTYTPDPNTQSASYSDLHIASNDLTTPDYNFYISGGFRATSLHFDGTDDFVSTANPLIGHNANFCIEGWIKSPSTTVRRSIVSLGASATNQGVYLYINSSGKLAADMAYNAGPVSNSVVADDKWHHVALVCTANSFQLYIDGLADGSPMTMAPAFVGNVGLIGATYNFDLTSKLFYFSGSIDEVRIWTVSRTPAEIFSNMLTRINGPAAGLEANYFFDDGIAGGSNQTANTLTDKSGYGNNGTLTNFTLLGTSSNWISAAGLILTGNGYILRTGSTSYKTQDNTNFGFASPGSTITKSFVIKNTGMLSRTIAAGGITINGTNPSDYAVTGISLPVIVKPDSAITFTITYTPNPISSLVSEAIVNVASNDFFIPAYSFAITAGITATSLNFDGTDDYVRAANPFTGANNMTIEAWVKSPIDQADTRNIVTFGNDIASNGFILYMQAGLLKCKVYGIAPISESTVMINDGNWHHVAVVHTSGSFQLFVDGLPTGTPIAVTPDFLGPNIQIGTSWQANYNFWLGNIDEVRFWTVARTQTELQNNMWCEINGPQTGLAGCYHFSQGASGGFNSHVTTLTDASGNTRTGNLNNFALSGSTSNWIRTEAMNETDITGNGIMITDGDNSPAISDSTDFCFTLLNIPVTRTFVIHNSGAGDMVLNTGDITTTGSGDFTVGGINLPVLIAPGYSLPFTVTYFPTANGTDNATVSVITNDCDEALYTFAVTGTGYTGFTGITADPNTCDGNVQLSWSWSGANPGIYEIERSSTPAFISPVVVTSSASGSTTSYNDIPPVGQWYYRIRSIDGCGKAGNWYHGASDLMATYDTSRHTMNLQAICNGSSYFINNHTYTVAGTYHDTLATHFGCDSIITTLLTVHSTFSISNPQEICIGDTYSFNGHDYSTTGTYYDTLLTQSGCDSVIVTALTVNDLPSAFAGNDVTGCPGDSVYLTASGGVQYLWSNGTAGATNGILPTGQEMYTVTVTDAHGCTGTDDVNVVLHAPFNSEEICLVTVDTLVWKNKVMWEGSPNVGTDRFRVYKESQTNVYDLIGEVPYGSQTYLIDMNSNPESHSDRYKISVVDYCGNESDSSMYHNTMNLVISVFGSTMGLVWTPYQTEDGSYTPNQYYIYKGPNPSNMTLLTTVSGSQNTYNDMNVFDLQYYMIGAERNCNTYPTFSNKRDNGLVGINTASLNGTLLISPNPMSTSAMLTIPNLKSEILNPKLETGSSSDFEIRISDLTGKVVRVESPSSILREPQDDSWQIDRGNLKPGVYFVELKADRVYRGKLVVE